MLELLCPVIHLQPLPSTPPTLVLIHLCKHKISAGCYGSTPPPQSSPTGIVCSMESKLDGSQILITLVRGGGPWWLTQVRKAPNLTSAFAFLFFLFQQNLLRQQERVEERVQEMEEQLCKLDSDKCVVEVC